MNQRFSNGNSIVDNVVSLTRSPTLLAGLDSLNIGKDIDFSCGYPTFISTTDYTRAFAREGIAKRIVSVLPSDTWAKPPVVKEKESTGESEFDKEWVALVRDKKVFHYLLRSDVLSGVGRFGVLLLGLSDGLQLEEEVVPSEDMELLYLRPFSEAFVEIRTKDNDPTSERFGFPETYNIRFEDTSQFGGLSGSSASVTRVVHWTRIIHLADNREESEIFGTPRMKPVYNRILDVRKILSGSGEMFWKGAFPGYGLEINNEIKNPNLDAASVREEFKKYSTGLQRYMAFEGGTIKSLEPQIADPSNHLKSQYEYIGLTLELPLRILLGSEQAKLASAQDKNTWNERIKGRQKHYAEPMVLREFIDRLIDVGVLTKVEEYIVIWPDLNTPSDKEQMEVGKLASEAMARYVSSGADQIMSPKHFFIEILGFDEKLAKAIEDEAMGFIEEEDNPGNPKKDEEKKKDG